MGRGGVWGGPISTVYLKPHFLTVDYLDQLSVFEGAGNRDIGVAF
jgi:hypothetical protein